MKSALGGSAVTLNLTLKSDCLRGERGTKLKIMTVLVFALMSFSDFHGEHGALCSAVLKKRLKLK